jgi:hypothetical protein
MQIKLEKLAACSALFLSLGASLGFSTATLAASASHSIEQISSQLAPSWKSMKPACVMALDIDTQMAVSDRLEFLDGQLVANRLNDHLSPLSSDKNKAWNNQVWGLREQLERSALSVEEREPLREYFFKLQTQTPNADRAKLVSEVQFMSEQLNITLRKELWKTCHALGFDAMPQEQLETAINQRWLKQKKKVTRQLNRELAAFYFYSFRQVQNLELAVLAKTAAELNPWVKSTSEAIETYFYQVRTQLLATNLKQDIAPVTTDETAFPNAQTWNPNASKSPF